MGSALAERFRAAGCRVVGFDLRDECPEAARGDRRRTGRVGRARCSRGTRVVVLSLPNSDVVAEVIRGGRRVARRRDDHRHHDRRPGRDRANSARTCERGADYLDATLTGSSAEARRARWS